MPYSLVLERASGTHIYSVQQELSLLTSTCSVVCLLPQVHSNKLRLAALEALCFILFGALQRSGKEWSYIWIYLIGDKIRELRKSRGITQEQLAQAIGISFQAVSKWENHIALPDIALVPTLANYFGITCDELLALTR